MMKTPKTCEQYVLNELAKAKGEVKVLKNVFNLATKHLEEAEERMDILKKYAKVHRRDNGKSAIIFEYVFEEYNKEDYDKIVDFLGLEVPEDEGEDD